MSSKYNANDVLDMLDLENRNENSDIDDDEINIGVVPPYERPDAISDADSDLSDGEVEGHLHHLPARMLKSEVATHSKTIDESEEVRSTVEKKLLKKVQPRELEWSREPSSSQDIVLRPKEELNSKIDVETPIHVFQEFLDTDFVDLVIAQSKLYSQQRSYGVQLGREDFLAYLGVLIFSGYHQLPRRRLYWEQSVDTDVTFVSNAIRRDTFENVHRCLHFCDNQKMDQDRMYKVRPLFDIANKNFKKRELSNCLSIDEQMLRYFGSNSSKQCIRTKSIRFGFKNWTVASDDGYIYHAEPYCGASTRLPTTGLGQGADVVLGLIEHCNIPPNTYLYFDNLFTSVSLMQELSRRDIGGTGTLRENMAHHIPVMKKSDIQKELRGYISSASCDDLQIIRWNDNSVVTLASNCHGIYPLKAVSRYSKKARKYILVDMPNAFNVYDSKMGGVDLADTFLNLYRFPIRSKKWWWPFMVWFVKSCLGNSFICYRQSKDNNIDYLKFLRYIACFLIERYGRLPTRGRLSIRPKASTDLLRFDGLDHWTDVTGQKKARCCQCGGRTKFGCSKCRIPLHPECMKVYHTA